MRFVQFLGQHFCLKTWNWINGKNENSNLMSDTMHTLLKNTLPILICQYKSFFMYIYCLLLKRNTGMAWSNFKHAITFPNTEDRFELNMTLVFWTTFEAFGNVIEFEKFNAFTSYLQFSEETETWKGSTWDLLYVITI